MTDEELLDLVLGTRNDRKTAPVKKAAKRQMLNNEKTMAGLLDMMSGMTEDERIELIARLKNS